jgi:hypothetical protein
LLQTDATILLESMDICFPMLQCIIPLQPWTWRQKVSPKRRYPSKSHGTIIYISATMKIVRLRKSYYRNRPFPKACEREVEKCNFRSKREFNYLLKNSNTPITYIVHYPLHKQPCHKRTEFKPCTNKNEEKYLSHTRQRNGEQYWMIQDIYVCILVPNGQSDDALDMYADNHWNPKHGRSMTLGVMLAQVRVIASRDMNDNDAEWPPEKVCKIFHDSSNKDNSALWSVRIDYCTMICEESLAFLALKSSSIKLGPTENLLMLKCISHSSP